MQKVFVSVLSLSVVLGAFQSAANAALTMSRVQTKLSSGDLWSVTVNFKASEGVVSAFQGMGAGAAGFTGAFNQQLAGGALPTPTTDFNALIDEALDTQFLFANADVLAVTAAGETANSIGGVFTLQNAARSNDKNLLQIVATQGTVVNYDFTLAEAIGSDSPLTTFQGSFVVGIPEPATFAMAGLGLVGLVAASRRRKA